MPNTTEKLLLREYVRESLNEESRETLNKIFINPFTDVAKTVAHGVEQLAVSTKVAFKVFVKGMTPAILGMVNETYAEIFSDARSRAREIQSKYSDVFKATDKAFENDAQVLAFFVNPQMFAAAKAIDNTLLASMHKTAVDIVDKMSKTIMAAGDRTSRASSPEALDRRIRQKFNTFSRRLERGASPEDLEQVKGLAFDETKAATIDAFIGNLEDLKEQSGVTKESDPYLNRIITITLNRLNRLRS